MVNIYGGAMMPRNNKKFSGDKVYALKHQDRGILLNIQQIEGFYCKLESVQRNLHGGGGRSGMEKGCVRESWH